MPTTLRDSQTRCSSTRTWNRANSIDDSIEVVFPVLHPRVKGITKEIIHSIRVHLTIDQIAPEESLLSTRAPLEQSGNIFSSESIIRDVQRVIFDCTLQFCSNDGGRVILMLVSSAVVLLREKALRCVRKRSMSYIVQQGGKTNKLQIAIQPLFFVPKFVLEYMRRRQPNG